MGRKTAYEYNDEGDIWHVALPGGYSLYYDYNDAGQLTRLTLPGDQVWQWDYDDKGSMVTAHRGIYWRGLCRAEPPGAGAMTPQGTGKDHVTLLFCTK
nr:RHS repeat protein [Escherichia coli]